MYVELDHSLIPGKLSDINDEINLPIGKEAKERNERIRSELNKGIRGCKSSMNVKKYQIQPGDFFQALTSYREHEQRFEMKKEYHNKSRHL